MNQNTNVARTQQTDSSAASRDAHDSPQQVWVPAVDIAESDSGITLLADMPGVSKDRLTVKVEGDSLLIEGRAQLEAPDDIELLHSEVRGPYFRRSFTLSRDLDAARIEASLKNGVLRMHIPQSEAARPKRIEITVD